MTAGSPDQSVGTVTLEEWFERHLTTLLVSDVPVRLGALLSRSNTGQITILNLSFTPEV